MSYAATVINVMIASPADVMREREEIRATVHEWNAVHSQDSRIVLMPIGWDSHASPLLGSRPQQVVNEQVLDKSDLLVAVFWTRLGSPTGESASGTVEEIERHVASGKPAMIYFSQAPVRMESVDEAQYKALVRFRNSLQEEGLLEYYDDVSDFTVKFRRQLAQTVLREFAEAPADGPQGPPYFVPFEAAERSTPSLSKEAVELLLEAAQDRSGHIMRLRSMGGTSVSTNGKVLNERGNARSEALWESAIEELATGGFIEDRSYRNEVFYVTHAGYQLADRLKA